MKKVANNILAEGEVTGHYHQATGDGCVVLEAPDGALELRAKAGAEVTHQEHGTVTVPPGQYTRHIVIEQDHAADEARAVRD